MDGGTQTGAMPVYQYFVEIAKKLKSTYISMIMPSRWFAGGRGLDDFRKEMLEDKSLSMLVDFPKARDCFSNVDIAGGICYFLRDNNYKGMCNVISSIYGKRTESKRDLGKYSIFIRDNVGQGIIEKVEASTEKHLDELVLKVSPFGIRSFIRGEEKDKGGQVRLKSSSGFGYIDRSVVTKNKDLIGKYKVSCGYLNPDRAGVNNASDGKNNVTTKLTILKPNEVITETYIVLGAFDTKEEAENYASYIRTKLVRFLVLMTMTSMHITQANFQFVPIQDFGKAWNDDELNVKYGLSELEITYIDSMIRVME